MSDREYLTEPFDEDEERAAAGYVHPAVRSYMYSPMGEFRVVPVALSQCDSVFEIKQNIS